MNKTRLACTLLLIGLAHSLKGELQFQVVNSGGGALNRAAYNGMDQFVAVGDGSRVLATTFTGSGLSRATNQVPQPNLILQTVAFGGGNYLAGGQNAKVFSSGDGLTWTARTVPFANNSRVMGLAYNGGRFLAAASLFQTISWTTNLATSWVPASFSGNFLESYRDVTAFGGNQFAVCGIRGNIRVSSDGGQTFSNQRSLSVDDPDLLGIASDGGNLQVGVGTRGFILVTTDAWTSWTTNVWTTNATLLANTTLNGVAFLNPGFIAVGNGGIILTSPDGLTWDNVSSSNITADLLGVTAGGTSGNLAGVAFLVGANGTIALGATPPPAPINPVNATNCAESLPNPPLSVSTVTNAAFPTNTVTVDWYATQAGGSPVASGTLSFASTDQLPAGPNAPSNYTYYAEARDLRTGFVSTNRTAATLTINPRPTATASGTTTICNGDMAQVRAALTGIGPWTVVWSSNGVAVATNSGVVASPDLLTVSPTNLNLNSAAAVTYTVTALSDANCVATPADLTGNAVITINPRPTATVSGTTTICNGDMAQVRAALTGIGPWTVVWSSNGVAVATNSGVVASPDSLTVSPVNPNLNAAAATTYTVTALSDANCVAAPGDLTGNAVITINPRPTATVSGTTTICNGDMVQVQAALTGIGPWTVTWSSNGVAVATNSGVAVSPNLLTVNPTNLNLNSAVSVTYTVTALSDANCVAAPGDLSGSAVVTINPRPTATVSGDTNIVTGQSAIIQAALTGIAPWTVTWSDGVVSNNVNSSPLQRTVSPPVTTVYTVTNLMAGGCAALPGDLSGSATVSTIIPELIIRTEGTDVILEWFGDLYLQSATNLNAPISWSTVIQGGPGMTNLWTNSVIPPPTNNFFRLSTTNSP